MRQATPGQERSFFGVHSAKWCVKTKGMYTGKDWKYRFPFDNSRAPYVSAIELDYYEYLPALGKHQIYLQLQDPVKPKDVCRLLS